MKGIRQLLFVLQQTVEQRLQLGGVHIMRDIQLGACNNDANVMRDVNIHMPPCGAWHGELGLRHGDARQWY